MSITNNQQTRMMECPVCHGKGSIGEDPTEYEFITRDPDTHVCLTCQGTGKVGPRKKLPDGKLVFELAREKRQDVASTRLNVSRKAVVHPELPDTGVGYKHPMPPREKDVTPVPIFQYWDYNQLPARLNKVLEEGKPFLIVVNTEPYYMDVYRMIRKQEKKQRTWTEGDEEAFVEALMDERNKLITEIKKYKLQDEASTKEVSNG